MKKLIPPPVSADTLLDAIGYLCGLVARNSKMVQRHCLAKALESTQLMDMNWAMERFDSLTKFQRLSLNKHIRI